MFLKLWVTKETVNEVELVFSAKDILLSAIGPVPVKGYTIAQMRSRLKLAEALEAVDPEGEIELTESDKNFLSTCLEQRAFTLHLDNLIKLADLLA